jgi:hypothetical protein
MAQNGRSRIFKTPVPVRNEKTALWVRAGPGLLVVMVTKSLCNFAEREAAIGAGLPVVEEGEALPANGTAHIRGIRSGLAQNLHTAFAFH